MKQRIYPIGIQSFEKLRRDGYIYVDKTALIYKLVTTGSYQEGLRACTSFIKDHQYAQLDERMRLFAENHPVA